MRKVLRKVKSQWAVLGIMGATVIALGAADVPHVSADEIEGATTSESVAGSESGAGSEVTETSKNAVQTNFQESEDSTNAVTQVVISEFAESQTPSEVSEEAPAAEEVDYATIVTTIDVAYPAVISRDTDAINTAPWGIQGYQTTGSSAYYVGRTVDVIKEQVTDYGVTWALVSMNGKELGWIAKDALTVQTYAAIVSETAVEYPATISRATDAINTSPWGIRGYQTFASSADYAGKAVEVTKEATTDYGVTWALVSLDAKELGWIAKDALTTQTYAAIVSETAVEYPAVISRDTDAINTAPWGTKGYQTISTSAAYAGQTVEVTKEQTTDYGVTWAQISLNGESLGWIAKEALTAQTYAQVTKETAVAYSAMINRDSDAINTAPWGTKGYQTLATSAAYVGQTVEVTKEQETDYGVTWAQVSLNGEVLGWIAKDALKVQTYAQITEETAVDYSATISRATDAINTAPWGTKGYQTLASSADYVGKTVDVAKEQVTDYGVTWAQISLNGEVLGWIAKDALAIQNYAKIVSETNVDYPATINRGTDAISTAPWGTRGYQTIGSSADYVGKSVEILKEQVTDYGVTWALVYIGDTELGWITKDALTQSNYVQILSTNEVAYDAIVTRGTDGINDQPWGTKGFETIGTSADYLNSIVTVTQEKVADNGVTWALINKDGRAIGWVDRAALTVSVNDTSQANLISLGEVQALVSGITPYFEVYVWDDQSHITITGDYMYIYNNYDSNLWRYTYDAWIDQVFNAINAKGWDGEATVNASYFMINLPLNQ